jgi:hypothetical protein
MDGITVKYNTIIELMDCVRPCYDYSDWMWLDWYMQSMWRYVLSANYIQLINNGKNKGEVIYIDGRHKYLGNITGFINITQPGTTNKQLNFIYEGHEGNQVVMCTVKRLLSGKSY